VTKSEAILNRVRKLPPPSPTVARLSELIRGDSASAADFEEVLRFDPGLTAQTLRLANSAHYGLRGKVESIQQAVTVLGHARVFGLATRVAVSRITPARLHGYEIDASDYWLHNTAVAVLSEELAGELKLRLPSQTFTAGLLHDIGKLVISTFVEDASEAILRRMRLARLSFDEAESEVLGMDHAEAGALVAEAWDLPEGLITAIRYHHCPESAPEGPHRILADLVHVGDALAHSIGLGADAGELARKVDSKVTHRLNLKPQRLERVAMAGLVITRDVAGMFAAGPGGKAA